jgi:8-oxo-dGTP pyrophosphatase MutT (NUDIX family)
MWIILPCKYSDILVNCAKRKICNQKGKILQPLQRENIRLAATVMIVRDSDANGVEVYMVKRPGKGDFPDLYVFPGGKVDEDDWQPSLCPDMADGDASVRLGLDSGAIRYWVAVARECFEEVGVLLAKDKEGLYIPDNKQRSELARLRVKLLSGEVSWSQVLQTQGLSIASERLVYFSHWLTPPSVPRRFDTRFFLAALPEGQIALADTQETISGQWINPGAALQLHKDQAWQMIDPTIKSLETLSQYTSAEEALAEVAAEKHVKPWSENLGKQGMQPFR